MTVSRVSTVMAAVARHVERGRNHRRTRDRVKVVRSLVKTSTHLAASLCALSVKLALSLMPIVRAARTVATLVIPSFLPQAQLARRVLQERHRMTAEANAFLAWPERRAVQELNASHAARGLLLPVIGVVVSRAVCRILQPPSSTVQMVSRVASVGRIPSL